MRATHLESVRGNRSVEGTPYNAPCRQVVEQTARPAARITDTMRLEGARERERTEGIGKRHRQRRSRRRRHGRPGPVESLT